MTDLLALPTITNIDKIVETVPRPASGIPINPLPGWEQVPLYSKLPLLEIPTNEIVFTREKIGKTWLKRGPYALYDPNRYIIKFEYEPLHDPHLKYFFKRSANFERIKDLALVTDNKDVHCNLKQFNAFRRYLRRIHVDAINEEIQRRDLQQQDRFLLKIAEDEADKQAKRIQKSVNRTRSKINLRKDEQERAYREKAIEAYFKCKSAIQRIEAIKHFKVKTRRERSRLKYLTIKERVERLKEMEKMRIITLKGYFMRREEERIKFFQMYFEEKRKDAWMKKVFNWKKKIEYRIWKQEVDRQLRDTASFRKAENIEKHKRIMQTKWDNIQIAIENKRKANRKKSENLMKMLANKLNKKIIKADVNVPKQKSCRHTHSEEELHDVLRTALSMHNIKLTDKIPSDMIIHSAKFILENVVESITRDLSEDKLAMDYLKNRLEELFCRVRKQVLLQVYSILQANNEIDRRRCLNILATRSGKLSKSHIPPLWLTLSSSLFNKTVAFQQKDSFIETTEKLDPCVELKQVKDRPPTPASSFSSLNAINKTSSPDLDSEDGTSKNPKVLKNYELPYWSVKERIYVEHLYIKFKKALHIGVQKAVYEAIDFKKNEMLVYAKKEILDLDREYVKRIMAESILAYNLNNYNYIGNTQLCISVLAAECLHDLEKTKIQMKYDPAYKVEPRCRGAMQAL